MTITLRNFVPLSLQQNTKLQSNLKGQNRKLKLQAQIWGTLFLYQINIVIPTITNNDISNPLPN